MSTILRRLLLVGSTAVLALCLVPELGAQVRPTERTIQRPQVELPAVQQARATDACAFDIRLDGHDIARGIIIVDSRQALIGPESRDVAERGIIIFDSRVDPERMRDCTSNELAKASPELMWVRVDDLSKATGDGDALRADRGTLQTGRAVAAPRPAVQRRGARQEGRDDVRGEVHDLVEATPRLAVRRQITISNRVVSVASSDGDEEVQMFPVADLMGALGVTPDFGEIEPRGRRAIDRRFIDLKVGTDCALCWTTADGDWR